MGIFDTLKAMRDVVGQDAASPSYKPTTLNTPVSKAYSVDAYGVGEPEETNSINNTDALNKLKDNAKQNANNTDIHQFDNGTKIESYTVKGETTTFVSTGKHSYSTTAKDTKDFTHSFNKDGETITTDRKNGTAMTTKPMGDGFMHDVSQFKPSVDKTVNVGSLNGASALVTQSADGKTHVSNVKGNMENAYFVKGKDNGIRTINGNGELVLAETKHLPKDISRADRKAHNQLLDKVKDNPELADMQGVPNKPQPAKPAQQASEYAPVQDLKASAMEMATQEMAAVLGKATSHTKNMDSSRIPPPQAQRAATPATNKGGREL